MDMRGDLIAPAPYKCKSNFVCNGPRPAGHHAGDHGAFSFGGAHRDPAAMADTLKKVLFRHLEELRALKEKDLLDLRYKKFRDFGEFKETGTG